jgi:hypothetical protein
MSRRRIAAAFISVAALLFAGRWAASLIARRAWAEPFGADAVAWLTQLSLLQLALDTGGALVASAWFIGNLVAVHRGIERVQVSRSVADGEVRESVQPRTLLGIAVGLGLVLGILAGGDFSSAWAVIVLAWQGVTTGVREPLLGQDAGVYLSQVPLWLRLHDATLMLVLVAALLVLLLYAAIGALRWTEGRLALTDHARHHLGWLAAALALVAAFGFLLEPVRWITDGPEAPGRTPFTLVELSAPVLTGFALATALLSIVWAVKGRHAVFAAGWFLLLLATVTAHYVLPSLQRTPDGEARDPVLERALDAMAAGLDDLTETQSSAPGSDVPSAPALWTRELLARVATPDSSWRVVAADPAPLEHLQGAPGWLVLRQSAVRLEVTAWRDDRVLPGGAGAPTPNGDVRAVLRADAVRPEAPSLVIGPRAHGPRVGSLPRRLLLAWALQAPALLPEPDSSDVRAAWLLDPRQRLSALAPFAEWGQPILRLSEGRPVWLLPGYVLAEAFPLVRGVPWRGGLAAYVHADFVGVVDAETGTPRLFLRPDAGPVGRAWARFASAIVLDSGVMPDALREAEPYPAALLAAQARVLARREPTVGRVAVDERGTLLETTWHPDPVPYVAFDVADGREIGALLEGRMEDGRLRPRLVRLGKDVLPAAASLRSRWVRFPTFAHIRDSVRAAQGVFDEGRVRVVWDGDRPLSIQTWTMRRTDGTPAVLAWVSLAAGERLGAGRTFAEAWENLLGVTSPVPAGTPGGQLEEARRWMRVADEALGRGDLAAFARAFEALRNSLGAASAPR